MAKTDWQMGDTVQPEDLNQLGQEINDNAADLADHRAAAVLDHPDGSVTTEKLADGAVTAAKVAADVATQAELDAHTNATSGVHGATSAATANRIIQRDSAGRAKVAAPAAADDIARKDTVDAVQTNLNSHKSAVVLDHPDGSVTSPKLADGAVTTAKLASGAVTSANLASGAATDTVFGNRTISDTSAPTGDTGTPTNLWSWLAYMIKAITGKSSWRTAPATTLEAAKSHMDATTGVHGATSTATANRLVIRDADGRFKAAAPSASEDVARKAEVDAVQSNLESHKNAAVLDHPDGSVTTAKIADGAVTPAKISSKILEDGTSLNDANDSGFYRLGIGHTDAPNGVNFGQMIVSHGRDTLFQIATGFQNNKFYMRHGNPNAIGGGGTIQPWQKLVTSSENNEITELYKFYGGIDVQVPSVPPAATGRIYANGASGALNYHDLSAWQVVWHTGNMPIEYGEFTPHLILLSGETGSHVYANQYGYYHRIGDRVFFELLLTLSTKDSSWTSGVFDIGGLPYPNKSGTGRNVAVTIANLKYLTIDSSTPYISAFIMPVSSKIRLARTGNNVGSYALTANYLNNNTSITISGNYRIFT